MSGVNAESLREPVTIDAAPDLLPCLARLAQLQHESVDRLAVQAAAEAALSEYANDPKGQLKTVAAQLQVVAPRWLPAPDAARMPALVYAQHGEQVGQWGVLRGQNAQGHWISDWWDVANNRWNECADAQLDRHAIATLRLTRPYSASNSPVYQLITDALFAHSSMLREAVVGGVMINLVALVTSFYSMQVYDRVIPTAASQTLLVLTLGVLGAATRRCAAFLPQSPPVCWWMRRLHCCFWG